MSQHVCPRCGHEDECSYGSWADRHAIMAVIAGLFTLTFMGMMFSVYPPAASAITAVAAAAVGVRALDRRRRRRAALAVRAEYEHAAMIARSTPQPIRLPPREPIPPPPPLSAVRPRNPAPWHVVTQQPTGPLARIRRTRG